MRTDHDARQQVFELTCELFAMGQLTPTGGNVSARAADDDKIWITPSQMYKGGLKVEDIVCIDREGELVEGSLKPSVEHQMHWACYEAHDGTTGAVHTHAPYVTAFGITGQKFPPINTDAIFLATTQIVPWFMPGSKELADAVGEAVKQCAGGKSRGAILQCHGLMAVGRTIRDAATRAIMMEETSKLVLYCKQFGGELAVIPPEWVENLANIANFI